MQSLGIDVNINKRNSLFVGNLKFSGHAEHIFHDRVLHHGTILFNTDLEILNNCLSSVKEFQGKALTSVRSDVGNISPLLSEPIKIDEFIHRLAAWLIEFYPGSKSYKLQTGEIEAIKELSEIKYKTWEWNFGYSPAYTFVADIPMLTGFSPVRVRVENGKFVQIDFLSEIPINPQLQVLYGLTGVLYKEDEIDKFVKNNIQSLELAGINIVSFTEAFFK